MSRRPELTARVVADGSAPGTPRLAGVPTAAGGEFVPREHAQPSALALGLKRAMDLVGAAVMLVVLAPVFAAIAVAIWSDSPGRVLFFQRRIGRDGRPFRVVKFRTMVDDAEALLVGLRAHSRDPSWLLLDRDPRVTGVGRLLRVTSLDELPQLWNVLRGDMSLVGPRPVIEVEYRRMPDWASQRSSMRPGITGLWQVSGRTSIPFAEMLSLDVRYVRDWSLGRDIALLARTIPAVLTGRGAN